MFGTRSRGGISGLGSGDAELLAETNDAGRGPARGESISAYRVPIGSVLPHLRSVIASGSHGRSAFLARSSSLLRRDPDPSHARRRRQAFHARCRQAIIKSPKAKLCTQAGQTLIVRLEAMAPELAEFFQEATRRARGAPPRGERGNLDSCGSSSHIAGCSMHLWGTRGEGISACF